MNPDAYSKKNQSSKRKKKKRHDGDYHASQGAGTNSGSDPNSKSYQYSNYSGHYNPEEYYENDYEENPHHSYSPQINNYHQPYHRRANMYSHQGDHMDHEHDPQYVYESYKYGNYPSQENYDAYPYVDSPKMHQYENPTSTPINNIAKKTKGVASKEIQKENPTKDQEKTKEETPAEFGRSPAPKLHKSQKGHSDELSTKQSHPMQAFEEKVPSFQKIYGNPLTYDYLPHQKEDEEKNYVQLFPQREGYDSFVNIQSLPNIGPLQKADSPSNYKPFGTHFGPKILNRYGSNADYYTPQARGMVRPMQNPYSQLTYGDSSSKSNPFGKVADSKTMPALVGFSSLVAQVAHSVARHGS